MRNVLMGDAVPEYLNQVAVQLLTEGRQAFEKMDLAHRNSIAVDGRLYLFPWAGTVALESIALALRTFDIRVLLDDLYLEIAETDRDRCSQALMAIAGGAHFDPVTLAELAENTIVDKYDGFLTENLRSQTYASSRIDIGVLPAVARSLLVGLQD